MSVSQESFANFLFVKGEGVMDDVYKDKVPGIFWSVKSRNVSTGTFYCHAMEHFRTFHRMM